MTAYPEPGLQRPFREVPSDDPSFGHERMRRFPNKRRDPYQISSQSLSDVRDGTIPVVVSDELKGENKKLVKGELLTQG